MGRFEKRWAAGVAGTVVAVAALAACNPADGLASANVSVTTDQLATKALKQDKVAVQWLSCGASESTVKVKVDCLGRTDDQKKITVKGDVTEQLGLKCVRGHLTAVVGSATVFDVQRLGNCSGAAASSS